MGFSVQLFETLAWAEELLEPATAADVPRLPRLYTAAGYACFAGRAEAARANAHRATELERIERYEACAPGYASFIEALGSVYCGDLDRYVELTGGRRDADTAATAATGWRPTSTASSRAGRTEEALALTEESVAVARDARQPLLDRVLAVDRGHGVLAGRAAAARSRRGTRA